MKKSNNYYNFSCGCKFPIIDEVIKPDNLPSLHIPYEDIVLDLNYGIHCEESWKLIGDGYNKGIFQLESYLGHKWGSSLAPENLEEMSALISIIRPGCHKFDTKIKVKDKSITIEQLYQNKDKYKTLISLDEEKKTLFENNILDVVYSGEQECFRLKVRRTTVGQTRRCKTSSYELECTINHPLYTNRGWLRLCDLQVGDRILGVKNRQEKQIKPYVVSRNNPTELVENCKGLHNFKEICYAHYDEKCVMCGWNRASLDVHHINGNRYTDNTPENLTFLCPNHHREYECGILSTEDIIKLRDNYKLEQFDGLEWVTYIGCESVGIHKTYDIAVEGPNHNYIANNLVVHNCLNAITNGQSLTEKYVNRKWKLEDATPLHPALEDILNKSYQIMIYQEDSIRTATKIAGFSEEESDKLRKAVGVKDADLMKKVEQNFIKGCQSTKIVNDDEAKEIFSWIRESQRYSFNKSHGVSYGAIGYLTALVKYHFPLHFFCSWIQAARNKMDSQLEVKELVDEAQKFNINILTPNLSTLLMNNSDVCIDKDTLHFGLRCMKKFGNSIVEKIRTMVTELENQLQKRIDCWSWNELLFYLLLRINSQSAYGLITGGILDHLQKSRSDMLLDYDRMRMLTDKQVEYIRENIGNATIQHVLPKLLDQVNKTQKSKIQSIMMLYEKQKPQKDRPGWIIVQERESYGIPITYQPLDVLKNGSPAQDSCKQLSEGSTGKYIVAGQILNIRSFKIKKEGPNKGKSMCAFDLDDGTGSVNFVLFEDKIKDYESMLFEGNLVVIQAYKAQSKNVYINQMEEIY